MGEDDDVPLAQLIADIQDSIPLARLRGTGLLTPSSVAEFVSVDNDIVTTEERTEDEIIASLSTSSAAADDNNDVDDEDPEIAERKKPITKACATDAITTLRMYFECCENTDETIFKSLNTVEIAVSTSKQTQTSILDFLSPHNHIHVKSL